jgi:hypothetical protein
VGFPVSRDANLLEGGEVKREYHEFHRCPILFLGFVDLVSLDLLSIDAQGHIALWPYADTYVLVYSLLRRNISVYI